MPCSCFSHQVLNFNAHFRGSDIYLIFFYNWPCFFLPYCYVVSIPQDSPRPHEHQSHSIWKTKRKYMNASVVYREPKGSILMSLFNYLPTDWTNDMGNCHGAFCLSEKPVKKMGKACFYSWISGPIYCPLNYDTLDRDFNNLGNKTLLKAPCSASISFHIYIFSYW